MKIRPLLVVLIAVGGILLAETGTGFAAVTTTIAASDTGTVRPLPPTDNAKCAARPVTPVDFRCRFGVTLSFHNSKLHGAIQGVVTLNSTRFSRTGCSQVGGRLTNFVYRNDGHFLGSFTEQIKPTESTSCSTPKEPDIQTQLLKGFVVGGTGVYAEQQGSVENHSATVAPVNQNDPIVLAGTFVAQLHE